MDTQATLSVAAEIGIGVAGFSTITAAVLSRSDSEDLTVSWIQLRVLLVTSLAVTLLAYAPMIVGSAVRGDATIWRVCSSLYALWVLLVMLMGIGALKHLKSASSLIRRSAALSVLLSLTSITLNIVNALYLTTSWPYLTALACGILIAFVQFGLLITGLWLRRDLLSSDND